MAAAYERGTYMFRVTNQGFGESKNKGTPFFFLEGAPDAILQEDGTEAPVDATYTRVLTMYLTEKTIDGVTEYLKSQGWPGGPLSTLDPDRQNFYNFADERVVAVCKHEPGVKDPNEWYDKWEIPRSGAGELMQNDSKVARKLDALFGKKLGPAKAPAPAARPAPQPASVSADVPATDDSDIPF